MKIKSFRNNIININDITTYLVIMNVIILSLLFHSQ